MRVMDMTILGTGLVRTLLSWILLTRDLVWMGSSCTGDAAISEDVAGNVADVDTILQQLARQPSPSAEAVELGIEGLRRRAPRDLMHFRDNQAKWRPGVGRMPGFSAEVFSALATPVT